VPVIVREQLPDDRVHVGGFGKESEPDPPDCENATVPPGEDPPETVTVQFVDPSNKNDCGEQESFVVVAYLPVAISVMLPLTSV
jgi:hypothetical protein